MAQHYDQCESRASRPLSMTTTLLLRYKQGQSYIQHTTTADRGYIIALCIKVSSTEITLLLSVSKSPPDRYCLHLGGPNRTGKRDFSRNPYSEEQTPFRTYSHAALGGCGACQVCLRYLMPTRTESHSQHHASVVAMESLLVNVP